ncbi:hypothetical protein LINPERPRIM_LOCUS14363 [Linum perenne]
MRGLSLGLGKVSPILAMSVIVALWTHSPSAPSVARFLFIPLILYSHLSSFYACTRVRIGSNVGLVVRIVSNFGLPGYSHWSINPTIDKTRPVERYRLGVIGLRVMFKTRPFDTALISLVQRSGGYRNLKPTPIGYQRL